jgi:hypothetical protein
MGISVEARDDTPPNECSVVRFKSEEVVKGKGEERGEEGRPEARWRTDFIGADVLKHNHNLVRC